LPRLFFIRELSLEKRKRNAKGQIALSERQMRIIEQKGAGKSTYYVMK